jgi:ABC-2 type transport system ATP-binding protein
VLRRRIAAGRIRIRLVPGSVEAATFVAPLVRAGAAQIAVDGWTLSMTVGNPDEAAPVLVRALVEAGASIREVTDDTPPLEEAYLRLIQGEAAHRS